MDTLPQLAIGGISLPIVVFLLIKAMRYVELLKTSYHVRVANIVLSLMGGAMWLAVQLYPDAAAIVGLVVTAIAGSLGSALIHTLLEKNGG